MPGANWFQRRMRSTGGIRLGAWVYIRVLHRVDQPIFRATRGRPIPMVLLEPGRPI